jgi:hypothetical protein
MRSPRKRPAACTPVTPEAVAAGARQRFERVLDFCLHNAHSFWKFEQCLLALLAALGRLLVRVLLASRHQRLELQPYLQDGT